MSGCYRPSGHGSPMWAWADHSDCRLARLQNGNEHCDALGTPLYSRATSLSPVLLYLRNCRQAWQLGASASFIWPLHIGVTATSDYAGILKSAFILLIVGQVLLLSVAAIACGLLGTSSRSMSLTEKEGLKFQQVVIPSLSRRFGGLRRPGLKSFARCVGATACAT